MDLPFQPSFYNLFFVSPRLPTKKYHQLWLFCLGRLGQAASHAHAHARVWAQLPPWCREQILCPPSPRLRWTFRTTLPCQLYKLYPRLKLPLSEINEYSKYDP